MTKFMLVDSWENLRKERQDDEWLTQHLKSPKAAYSKSIMPKVKFIEPDIRKLTDFLLTLKE